MKRLLNRWFGRNPATSVVTESIQEADRLIEEGHALEDAGQWTEAETRYRQAVQIAPQSARAWLNLGNAQLAQQQTDEAIASYQQALRLNPDYGPAHANLGKFYLDQKDYPTAVDHYSAAARLMPDAVGCLMGWGSALQELQRYPEALDIYRQALAIHPDSAEIKLKLGQLSLLLQQWEPAAGYLEQALAEIPDSAIINALLGYALLNLNLIRNGLNHLRLACQRASEQEPQVAEAFRRIALYMNCLPDYSPQELFAAHLEYIQRVHAKFYPVKPAYSNARDPERRLRVGYMSPDFYAFHPVCRFIEPVLVHHDRQQIEVHCFYNRESGDPATERLKGLADFWHPIKPLADDEVANRVRELGIDLLIDLTGFTENHRLGVFARKPAPVQATWMGYVGTTGLATMDYRICDAYTDPPGLTEHFHTETLARLPDAQWCHLPYADLPPISPLPLLHNGYLTLGSFNTPAKLNDQVLALWARALHSIPQSRLYIACITADRTQHWIRTTLEQAGIDPVRLEFAPRMPHQEYLAAIAHADIALDPFPYNGGLTSLDTLIMGVPVVSLAGDHSIARHGVTYLCNIGLPELLAASPEEYLLVIQRLAHDPDRLLYLRQSLRERMQQSPFMDAVRFTRNLEALYRQMWCAWCDQQNSPHAAGTAG